MSADTYYYKKSLSSSLKNERIKIFEKRDIS